ncbi:MAG: four helix bundle protein [Flavobacteriales bacterium]
MQTEITTIVFDFQKLEVYKKSRRFHISCKSILKSIATEKYVGDQLGRASYSVVLNIAEGSAKQTKPDRKNFFTISRGSVFECVAILDILREEDKISEREYLSTVKIADEVSRILYAMIKNLEQ